MVWFREDVLYHLRRDKILFDFTMQRFKQIIELDILAYFPLLNNIVI